MSASPQTRRTRLAVFGSVGAERPALEDRLPSPAVAAVLERVYAAIAASAAVIASPIIDRAVAEGRISRVERHELRRSLADADLVAAHPQVVSLEARGVLREALAATRRAAPAIAAPVLAAAVAEERLTPAQEERILSRLRTSPASALRGRAAEHPGSVS